MTANELRNYFNDTWGVDGFPTTYDVDHETYANVCQEVFNNLADNYPDRLALPVHIGPHRGVMFKDVELTLRET